MAPTRQVGDEMVAVRRRGLLFVLLVALVVPATWTALVNIPSAFAVAGDPVLVAAGDIACDPANSRANGSDASVCQSGATANTIAAIAPQYLLPLGDTQYRDNALQGQEPTLAQYQGGYDTSWGQLTSRVPGVVVRPVPGNHEYGDQDETGQSPLTSAANYFTNFGPQGLNELPAGVTSPSSSWYSFDVPVSGGSWHVVALDGECAKLPTNGAASGCAAGSAQETWLAQDLSAHQGSCTLAYWHEPRWSTVSNGPAYADMWADLVAHHVTLSLHGHEHDYERYPPLGTSGSPATGGVAEFVVGTGGVNLSGPGSGPGPAVPSVTDGSHFGVLALTLHATSADYSFRTTDGATRDPGTLACPQSPSASPSPSGSGSGPTVTQLSPGYGPSAGGSAVAVTGSGFTAGAAVSFGAVAATSVTVNSATSLTATAPAGTSTVHVTVRTTAGTSATSPADLWSPTLASNGWTVTLAASGSNPAVGGSVTLTATANKDPGPTAYFLCVYDVTGGAPVQVKRQGSGSTASLLVSSTTAATHRYVAQVDDGTAGGANPQAIAPPAVITWGNPSPSPSPDASASPSPTGTTSSGPPATAAPAVSSLSPISGSSSGGTAVGLRGSGFDNATQVSFGASRATSVTVSSPTSLVAVAPAGSATVHVTATNALGTSATSVNDLWTPTFASNGWSVTLTSTAPSAAVGGSVTLTATANKDPGPTPYFLCIYDVSSGTPIQVKRQGQGTTATLAVSASAAVTRRYVAQVDDGTTAGGATQAVATPVVVTWGSSSATPSPTPSPAPSPTLSPTASPSPTASRTPTASPSATFSPTPSASASPTPAPTSPAAPTVSGLSPWYGPSTGGTTVTVTGSGFSSSGTTVSFGATRAAGVTVTSATTLSVTAPAGTTLADVTVTTTAGTSPTSTADRWSPTAALNGYSATLSASATTTLAGRSVTLTATSNKNLSHTAYYLCILDVDTGALLLRSGPGGTVQLTVTSSSAAAHRYVARIDDGNGGAGGQVQAASTPLRVAWT